VNRGLGRFLFRVVLPIVLVLGVVSLASRGVGLDFEGWLERHSIIELIGSVIGFGIAMLAAVLASVGAFGLFGQALGRQRRSFFSRLASFVGGLCVGLLALVLLAGLVGTLRDALRPPVSQSAPGR
jgi:hypothetical protein